MDSFTASPLCPSPVELHLDEIAFVAPELVVTASARRRVVACPACGHTSARVHSRYHRTLADLPWHGLRVRLKLRVRRFFCDVPGCPRRIFTERLPTTAAPHARRTARATSALEAIALALGGRAGARLAQTLGFSARPSALLGELARVTDPPRESACPARVLGVDDWAWRKGHRYGTILVDLERHRVIDLLPDREPATLAAWLAAHPAVEFISRDRAGGYAGALLGAPEAIQIADRFHLLRNLTDAVERAVERHHAAVRGIRLERAPPAPDAAILGRPPKRGGPVSRRAGEPTLAEQRKRARRERRRARYDQVVALEAVGASVAEIHRQVGLSRATVTRWLRADAFPERQATSRRLTSLAPHADYLAQLWQGGCHNATQLWHLLRADRGFRGGVSIVRDWVRRNLRAPLRPDPPASAISPVGLVPSSRRAAWLLTAPETRLNPAERRYVESACAASPALAVAHALAMEFRRMFDRHDPNALGPWLAAAEGTSELRSLARSLRRDQDAVLAAILFRWSNGQVEGQVNRLKLVKRTMYGRASFTLLRRRVLTA